MSQLLFPILARSVSPMDEDTVMQQERKTVTFQGISPDRQLAGSVSTQALLLNAASPAELPSPETTSLGRPVSGLSSEKPSPGPSPRSRPSSGEDKLNKDVFNDHGQSSSS